jgi:hypothetical protein
VLELLAVLALSAPPDAAELRLLRARPELAGTPARREAAPSALNKAQRRGPGTSQRQPRPHAVAYETRCDGLRWTATQSVPELTAKARRTEACPSRPRDPPNTTPA